MDLRARMKGYEAWTLTQAECPKTLPLVIRVDGKSFSTWTKGLDHFDSNMSTAFQMSAMTIMTDILTTSTMAYGQSDEVSFVIPIHHPPQTALFNNRPMKICTVIASAMTVAFNQHIKMLGVSKPPALFDARPICLPNEQELVNYMIWRQQDAVRNSISSSARHVLGKIPSGMNSAEMQEAMHQQGVNWNNYPDHFKRGWCIVDKNYDLVIPTFTADREYVLKRAVAP